MRSSGLFCVLCLVYKRKLLTARHMLYFVFSAQGAGLSAVDFLAVYHGDGEARSGVFTAAAGVVRDKPCGGVVCPSAVERAVSA